MRPKFLIFDFSSGITINKNLELALNRNSIKNLGCFAKSCKQGYKLCFDENDNALVDICACRTDKDSVNKIDEILQSRPKFADSSCLISTNIYAKNYVKSVKQLQELMSSLLADLSSVGSKIKDLTQSNIDDKDAFKDFIDEGFELQTVEANNSKIKKQFFSQISIVHLKPIFLA